MQSKRLLSFIKALARGRFLKNVAVVAGGTAVSQAIVMAFAPLITRLYGPEAYGLQSVFMSIAGLAGSISALSYPAAIVLPSSNTDAGHLVGLSILLGLATSCFAALFFLAYGDSVLILVNAEELGTLVNYVSLTMFVGVLSGVLGQWLIRIQAFRLSARYSVYTAVLQNLAKVGLGYIYASAHTLIIANIAGGILGTILTFIGWSRHGEKQAFSKTPMGKISTASIYKVALEYRDFPLLRTPQSLINGFSQTLPVLALASFFGPAAAGQFSIALTVLAVPAALLGSSVFSVFYPRITEAVRNREDAQSLIKRATLGLALISFLPYFAVMVGGTLIFTIIFGAEWANSGQYAQWLAPWMLLQFINKPAVAAIPALRLQGSLLVYEVFATVTKIIALALGIFYFENDLLTVAIYSITGVAAYALLILWVIMKSKHL